MSLKFEEIETPEITPGISRKTWDGFYKLTDGLNTESIPLELILTEYSGDNQSESYFSVDIKQGSRKFCGDEFTSVEEALIDADNRICELFNADEITNEAVGEY